MAAIIAYRNVEGVPPKPGEKLPRENIELQSLHSINLCEFRFDR
jgi:hypothetical protein